jgi:Flp pilus assembly protein TadD
VTKALWLALLLASQTTFDPFRDLEIPSRAKREFDTAMRQKKDVKCVKALPHLQKAVTMFPKYGEAYTEIGRCYVQMDKRAAAEEAFKQAIQFSNGIYPSVNLSSLYLDEGRLDDAQQLITPLLRKNPTEPELYAALARIYFRQGRVHEAEQAGLEAHSLGHDSPDIHLILAKIYESQKNRAALVTQLRLYLEEKPEGPAADQARKQLSAIQNNQ